MFFKQQQTWMASFRFFDLFGVGIVKCSDFTEEILYCVV